MTKSTKDPKADRPHMPGYGIKEDRKGLLPWKWARERLSEAHAYWIATARENGNPHCMPVWGLWMDNRFYFSTGAQTRKARNLKRNPHCIIAVERKGDSVVVEGVAVSEKNTLVRKRFGRLYQAKYHWDMSDFKEPLYVVRPRVAFGLSEANFVGSATRWRCGKGR